MKRVKAKQLPALPTSELRAFLAAALREVLPIEAKDAEVQAIADINLNEIASAGNVLFGGKTAMVAGLAGGAKSAYNKYKQKEELAALLRRAICLPSLPVAYRCSLTLRCMIDLINKGCADTWETCCEKYEEQVLGWTMETNTAENAEWLKATEMTARWAAII